MIKTTDKLRQTHMGTDDSGSVGIAASDAMLRYNYAGRKPIDEQYGHERERDKVGKNRTKRLAKKMLSVIQGVSSTYPNRRRVLVDGQCHVISNTHSREYSPVAHHGKFNVT